MIEVTSYSQGRIIIWLFPFAFAVHDIEEAFTIEWFLAHTLKSIRLPLYIEQLTQLTATQFSVSAILILILVLYICYAADRSSFRGKARNLFILAVAAFGANAAAHVVEAVVVAGYTPGLVTSTVLCLPYSGLVFYRLTHMKVISIKTSLFYIAAGALLQAPIALLALILGKLIA